MIPENPTLPVELDLEESGILYHLLLRAMMDDKILSNDGTLLKNDLVSLRHVQLLRKLGDSNDKLMGKT